MQVSMQVACWVLRYDFLTKSAIQVDWYPTDSRLHDNLIDDIYFYLLCMIFEYLVSYNNLIIAVLATEEMRYISLCLDSKIIPRHTKDSLCAK